MDTPTSAANIDVLAKASTAVMSRRFMVNLREWERRVGVAESAIRLRACRLSICTLARLGRLVRKPGIRVLTMAHT
jgi:hypothetical protein